MKLIINSFFHDSSYNMYKKYLAYKEVKFKLLVMFSERVNPVLYVVRTADSDQAICYELRYFQRRIVYISSLRTLLFIETKLRKKIPVNGF